MIVGDDLAWPGGRLDRDDVLHVQAGRLLHRHSQAWIWVAKSLQETWNKIKHVFDSNFDADTANKAIEEQYGKAKDQMWDEAKKHLANREQERAAQREMAAATYKATMESLLTEGEAQKEKQEQEYKQKLSANQVELEKAKKEWKDAIGKARQGRQGEGI